MMLPSSSRWWKQNIFDNFQAMNIVTNDSLPYEHVKRKSSHFSHSFFSFFFNKNVLFFISKLKYYFFFFYKLIKIISQYQLLRNLILIIRFKSTNITANMIYLHWLSCFVIIIWEFTQGFVERISPPTGTTTF